MGDDDDYTDSDFDDDDSDSDFDDDSDSDSDSFISILLNIKECFLIINNGSIFPSFVIIKHAMLIICWQLYL